MPLDKFRAANLANWDDRVPIPLKAKTVYDVDGFSADPERISPTVEFDRHQLGDVSGKSLLHQQCHIGHDTLSWARLGTTVTGVDFSEPAVADSMRVHTGPAVVVESEEDCRQLLMDKSVEAGSVLVIRNEGPRGGPGMRELSIPAAMLVGMGLSESVAMVTDGRYSGACVGHVVPEAAEGGPIGLVEDGDLIEIDIPQRKLNLLVDDAVLAERRKTWTPPEPKVRGGFLEVYRRNVSSADKGAVFGPMDD